MKIIYFLNKITSHHVAIAAMTSLDQKIYSELRSALHFRYSIITKDGYFFCSTFLLKNFHYILSSILISLNYCVTKYDFEKIFDIGQILLIQVKF